MATAKPKVMGYLPNDTPPFGKMLLLGFQHVMTMFPATVLCAILMKFPVSTVLTVTGLGTIVALLGAKLAAWANTSRCTTAQASATSPQSWQSRQMRYGDTSLPPRLSVVQAGFLATGIINVIVGMIIRLAGGKKAVDIVLPPVVTGSVACTIGIGLGAAALNKLPVASLLLIATGICQLVGCCL